nr:IS982 family transposase [Haloactinomyces albus]
MGLSPRLSDAELVTLAVTQALLGDTSEARWMRYTRAHLGHLLRYLPGQPGYNKRLRAASGLIQAVLRLLTTDTTLFTEDVWVVDSTPVECGRSRETAKSSDLAGWAEYGYCASHSRFFWGLRLHVVCTLAEHDVDMLRPARKGEAQRPGARLFKPLRQTIESINQTFKGGLDLERHGGRTPSGMTARLLQRILAFATAIWHNDKTDAPARRSLIDYDQGALGASRLGWS